MVWSCAPPPPPPPPPPPNPPMAMAVSSRATTPAYTYARRRAFGIHLSPSINKRMLSSANTPGNRGLSQNRGLAFGGGYSPEIAVDTVARQPAPVVAPGATAAELTVPEIAAPSSVNATVPPLVIPQGASPLLSELTCAVSVTVCPDVMEVA